MVSPTNPVSPEEDASSTSVAERLPAAVDGTTRFLALDKCIKGRDFIQVVEMEIASEFVNDSNVGESR